MRVALIVSVTLALLGCGGAPPTSAHVATAPHREELVFRRVTLDPTGATVELPGEPASASGMDAAPGRPATLDVERTADVAGLRFNAGVHDFVAHEIPDPAALAGQILQAASAQFQMTPVRADTTLVQGAFAADATFENASGLRLRMLVVVGRTRAYHPYVIGPRAAMAAHSAGVERFLHSLRFEDDDVPWQTGDGALTDGAAWTPAHPVGWRFSVDMPGHPLGTPVPSTIEHAEAITLALASPGETRGFRVTAWHFAPGARAPRDVIAILERDITTRLHGVIREDRPALVQGTGARALVVDLPESHMSARELIVVIDDMVYELVAFFPTDATGAMRADADRFLASFRLTHA